MCEIAVIDPEQASIEITHQIAAKFHEEQGDGLGVLAVHNEGDRFRYDTYKSTDPHWQTLYSFLSRNYDDAWRVVVHGRAKTTGDVNRETAHPINIDCDSCEFDYVIHNGHLKGHTKARKGLTSAGHNFSTEVDSEVIAHIIGEVPDTVEGFDRKEYEMRGNLHYLLLSENGILVHTGYKYHLSDNFTMTCSYPTMPDDIGFERGTANRWMLVTPGEEPEIETEQTNGTAYRTDYQSKYTQTGDGVWSATAYRGAGDAGDGNGNYSEPPEDDGIVRMQYEDLSEFEDLSVIRVAPGVLRIQQTDSGETTFLHKHNYPEYFYWWVPDEAPDNIETLGKKAKRRRKQYGELTAENMLEQLEAEDALQSLLTDAAEAAVPEEEDAIVGGAGMIHGVGRPS